MTKHCRKKLHSWTKRRWLRIIQIQDALWRNEATSSAQYPLTFSFGDNPRKHGGTVYSLNKSCKFQKYGGHSVYFFLFMNVTFSCNVLSRWAQLLSAFSRTIINSHTGPDLEEEEVVGIEA